MSSPVIADLQQLPSETCRWLLQWARICLQDFFAPSALSQPGPIPPGGDWQRGCFVSLHSGAGALRGCIGTFDTTKMLYRCVEEMSVAAATRDPRFTPLQATELSTCKIEISVLSPQRPIQASDICVGRHGLSVRLGTRRGILLPQVAIEHGWDSNTFLEQVCQKAGLAANCWRDKRTVLEAFEAQVFSE